MKNYTCNLMQAEAVYEEGGAAATGSLPVDTKGRLHSLLDYVVYVVADGSYQLQRQSFSMK